MTEYQARFDSYVPDLKTEFFIEKNINTDDGILNFSSRNKIDILSLIPRKHGFFDRLLHPSHTREIAHHIRIPLLVLPD